MDPSNYGGIKGNVPSSIHCGEVRWPVLELRLGLERFGVHPCLLSTHTVVTGQVPETFQAPVVQQQI